VASGVAAAAVAATVVVATAAVAAATAVVATVAAAGGDHPVMTTVRTASHSQALKACCRWLSVHQVAAATVVVATVAATKSYWIARERLTVMAVTAAGPLHLL